MGLVAPMEALFATLNIILTRRPLPLNAVVPPELTRTVPAPILKVAAPHCPRIVPAELTFVAVRMDASKIILKSTENISAPVRSVVLISRVKLFSAGTFLSGIVTSMAQARATHPNSKIVIIFCNFTRLSQQ